MESAEEDWDYISQLLEKDDTEEKLTSKEDQPSFEVVNEDQYSLNVVNEEQPMLYVANENHQPSLRLQMENQTKDGEHSLNVVNEEQPVLYVANENHQPSLRVQMENQTKDGENVPIITSKYNEEEYFIATKIPNVKQQSDNSSDSDNIPLAKLRKKHIQPRKRLFEATRESSDENVDYNDDELNDPTFVLGKKDVNSSDSTMEEIAQERKKARRKNKKKKLILDHQSKDNTINSSELKMDLYVN